MSVSVHIHRPFPEDAMHEFRARLHPDIKITFGPEIPVSAEYEVLVEGRPTSDLLKASGRLKSVIIPWAGLFGSTRDLLLNYPQLTVHNLHYNAIPTAETAFALLLAAAKDLVPIDRTFRQHDWSPRYQQNSRSVMLSGKTALIIGFGSIGKVVGRLCRTLDMNVLATRRSITTVEYSDGIEVHPAHKLTALLPGVDALIITVPHTSETEGLIGQNEIELLSPHAVIVNVGRGVIIDEDALFHALKEKRIHSAGLDVWYNYPADEASRTNTPPSNYPFWELDNVVMSPHRAAHNRERELIRAHHLTKLLNAIVNGSPIPNKVDLQVGY